MTNAFLRSELFGTLFCAEDIAAEFGATAWLARMLTFEAAWTRALQIVGTVTPEDAAIALIRIRDFDSAGFVSGSDRDGLPIPALVTALREGLAEGPARAIHSGATSQDVLDTAMVLTCLSVLDRLAAVLDDLTALIGDLIKRQGDRPMMARTRMQAALPAQVSLRLSAWLRPLKAHRDRLEKLRGDIGYVQIGGAIGQRERGDDIAVLVARDLGLAAGPVWQTDRSRMVAFGHVLTLLSGTLGKIGQDVALMAQPGVDELRLSAGGGSSAMPHKQNPVLAEVTVAIARFIAGQQSVLAQAMIHEQERSGAAWALEWLTLPAMAEATGAALRHCHALIASVERIGGAD